MQPIFAQHETTGGFQQTIDSLARTPLSQIVIFVAICSLVRIALYGYLKNTVPHKRHGVYMIAKFFNEAMDAVVYAGVFVFMLIRPFAVQAFLIPSGSMEQTLWVNDFIVANKAIYRYSNPKHGDIVVFRPPQRALNSGQVDVDFIKRCQGIPGDIVEVRNGKLWRNGQPVDEQYLTDSPDDGVDQTTANGHPISSGKDTKMEYDWKLIHYTGHHKSADGTELNGMYIPVQMKRDTPDSPAVCNHDMNGVCRTFAAGIGPTDDNTKSWVGGWRSIPEGEETTFEQELRDAPPAAVPVGYVLMMGDNRNHSYDGRAWGLVPREDVIGRSEFIWLPLSRWRVTR